MLYKLIEPSKEFAEEKRELQLTQFRSSAKSLRKCILMREYFPITKNCRNIPLTFEINTKVMEMKEDEGEQIRERTSIKREFLHTTISKQAFKS